MNAGLKFKFKTKIYQKRKSYTVEKLTKLYDVTQSVQNRDATIIGNIADFFYKVVE